MGQSQDVLNIVEMGQSVIGVCSIFGCFIKFEVDRELWMSGEPLEANKERQLPLVVTEKTRKDKMFNVIVEFCQSNGLFWDEPDRYGKPFLTDFCNTLWYIDGHHEVLASRSCSIPILFSSLSGFNKPELSKHRKRSISNMNREKLIEYASVLQEYATSSWIEQPQFTTFKPALFQLIESLSSYASYLSMRNKVMKLHHSSHTPSVNFLDASTVRYLPPCVSFSPLVKNINVYQIIHVNNLAPKSPRQRYLYVRELEKGFSVPCFFFTYSHGSNVGNYHFIWRAPEGGNGESSHTENMRLVEDIKKEIPVYHTRAMKQEFYNLIGRVSRNSKPYLLRSIYQSLSGDNSASRTTAEEEIDKRLIEVFSAEDPDIIVDLREFNTNSSDNYSIFWEKCSMFLSECTAVHERRHDTVVFMAKAISIRDLLQEVSKLCPTGTPIPSKSWVQLNFCPRNPCTHSSKRYTSKLKAKHIVQKRQFRKSHPDSHYCAASFRYMRDYAVKYRNLSLFVCIDDKHTIKVGEPGFPLAAAERGREVIVSTSNTFVVGDHDFSKFKITPSVTLLVDIPDTIEGSFYTGQVFIGLKDSVFEPSSPIRHATELYKILLRRMNGRSILFVYSDGGPDHRLTYLTVQLSLIALFMNLDLDVLIAGRTAPSHSWANPVERIMAIVNLGLQCIGVMRSEGSADFEKTIKSCNNMKDIRTKCSTFKEDVADSLKQPINLLESILIRLELKEKTFQIFEKASQKEIEDFWDILLKIDASLTREHSTQKSIEKLAGLQNFISHCCSFQKYFLTIKKCGKENCLVCRPVKMSEAIFAGEPCDSNFIFLFCVIKVKFV